MLRFKLVIVGLRFFVEVGRREGEVWRGVDGEGVEGFVIIFNFVCGF